MRVLLDTNILLDVALKRPGLHTSSEQVLRLCAQNGCEIWIAWHTAATVYYILSSKGKQPHAELFLKDLIDEAGVQVAPASTSELKAAFNLGMGDFEDAMQVAAALAAGVDVIVSRNKSDFLKSPLPVDLPEEFPQRVAHGS